MNLNKTAIVTLLSLATVIGFGGSAIAQNAMGTHMNGSGTDMSNSQGQHYGKNSMANLTTEQQATRQQVLNEFQTSTADMRQQLTSKNYEYKALLTSKPVDEQKVLAVSKEIQTLRDNLYQSRVAMDTQLAKAGIAMTGNHGSRGGNHMGMAGGRGCR
ncbi:zinc resistance protein [Yersinia similis]|uniref:Zinc resistance-associated protein n=1 Tax=Yersinia similis TaxID=367190 RepID=A0ABM5Q1R5_9GAMM|nr:periplasmic heavy metal sensor [Yersinia similis]AHK20450.1 zinc resistance protein [Yersinia similis]CFQ46937.1 zinc resistance protein [Yersinia similis]CNC02840.1 zinc resistance protein [Yersinia similis]CNE08607.1 zinc resistance protein [Yersinia similis]